MGVSEDRRIEDISEYKCQKCSGPYRLGADDVIATCGYCGFTFSVEDNQELEHLLRANILKEVQIRDLSMRWIEKVSRETLGSEDIPSIDILTTDLIWLPMFKVIGEYQVYNFGYKVEPNRVYRKIEERNRKDFIYFVLARRYSDEFGVKELLNRMNFTRSQNTRGIQERDVRGYDFSTSLVDQGEILSAEITPLEAEENARKTLHEDIRTDLKKKTDVILDCHLKTKISQVLYYHIPLWILVYSFNDLVYRIAISGHEREVILGEVPVSRKWRLKRWFKAVSWIIKGSGALFGFSIFVVVLAFVAGYSEWVAYNATLGIAVIWPLFFYILIASFLDLKRSLDFQVLINTWGKIVDEPPTVFKFQENE
ncbi:MAG: hypothetical protein ACTSSE_13150 [Candidatus Thorarchaeota archaeon]